MDLKGFLGVAGAPLKKSRHSRLSPHITKSSQSLTFPGSDFITCLFGWLEQKDLILEIPDLNFELGPVTAEKDLGCADPPAVLDIRNGII